ncbi:MAG TPA: cupredoxin domain-containing protein [Dehalococcoidia bacterium]|nr:cupredoxin domain-containing protein [Dehalococcoidia bacterium]
MRIKLLAILALAALTVFALACGDDDDDDTGDDANGDVSTTAPAGDATDAPADAATEDAEPTDEGEGDNGAESVAVLIADFAFDPSEFTVPAGSITFDVTNEDSVAHTFTVYTDEAFSEATDVNVSVRGGSSGSGEGEFEAGEYYFRCEFHPDMQGTFTAE